ncbi:MAG: tRNA pseudouridine(55) synthase TruB [Gemmatimonadota bacterium]
MTTPDTPLEGVLPVDKPVGPTSHDIVGIARRALRTRRIGHTGTLDPFASGLLMLCIGSATRIAGYLTGMDKRYTAVVRLGVSTDTDDLTGTVIGGAGMGAEAAALTPAEVEAALARQRGRIEQVPPAYSAKQRDGERAYVAAREGRAVALPPVTVHVHELAITRFGPPEVELDVLCSSGTYIRAIARDLGAALGTGGHLTALRRTAIGARSVENALPLDAIGDEAAVRSALLTPLEAIGDRLPRLDVTEIDAAEIRHGRALPAAAALDGTWALAAGGRLLAIAESADGRIRPVRVFP